MLFMSSHSIIQHLTPPEAHNVLKGIVSREEYFFKVLFHHLWQSFQGKTSKNHFLFVEILPVTLFRKLIPAFRLLPVRL
jgi:hypothetical protein